MDNNEMHEQIVKTRGQLADSVLSYWNQFSDFTTWQFWYIAALFVIPLATLAFTVDRRRILELFFFGYSVHMLWAYVDIALERRLLLINKYFLIPVLPFGFTLASSTFPVAYILLYQYCMKRNKSFPLFSIGLGVLLAFGFIPITEYIGILEMRRGMNLFYLFLITIAIPYLAYGMTKLALAAQRSSKSGGEEEAQYDRFDFKDLFSRRSKARN
ncbi:hypothetical protein FE782_16960 [Paenibacillus antri]|uniref:Uncharacterized protein n=1 Tax=Paenibacillus antri TaxID=2582848 RepID=A0A5R9G3X1_9BACL|nr:hypothetical protein [Paenibacillus antri]TLS51077.1 hypothetical protein FE782_16960 [Paenibacillus antri]